MGTTAATRSRWAADVAAEVRRQLKAGGADLAQGDPAEVASRMVATVPRRSPWQEIGPFYSTTGVARILGGITRQAVEDRRRRKRLIALRAASGWVYPAWQFDERNQPIRPLVEVHTRLHQGIIDEWTAASALIGPWPELGGVSVRDFLAEGGDPALLDDPVDETLRNLT